MVCKKEFSSTKNVREHVISVHMKQRPFSCKYCHKTFGTQPASCRHQKRHCAFNPDKGPFTKDVIRRGGEGFL